ncbi:MAG: hypothetical protein QF535_07785, partial [Anaerolineales bacterium]|nr:hypothetical protein [Anaerolineales bacterium]
EIIAPEGSVLTGFSANVDENGDIAQLNGTSRHLGSDGALTGTTTGLYSHNPLSSDTENVTNPDDMEVNIRADEGWALTGFGLRATGEYNFTGATATARPMNWEDIDMNFDERAGDIIRHQFRDIVDPNMETQISITLPDGSTAEVTQNELAALLGGASLDRQTGDVVALGGVATGDGDVPADAITLALTTVSQEVHSDVTRTRSDPVYDPVTRQLTAWTDTIEDAATPDKLTVVRTEIKEFDSFGRPYHIIYTTQDILSEQGTTVLTEAHKGERILTTGPSRAVLEDFAAGNLAPDEVVRIREFTWRDSLDNIHIEDVFLRGDGELFAVGGEWIGTIDGEGVVERTGGELGGEWKAEYIEESGRELLPTRDSAPRVVERFNILYNSAGQMIFYQESETDGVGDDYKHETRRSVTLTLSPITGQIMAVNTRTNTITNWGNLSRDERVTMIAGELVANLMAGDESELRELLQEKGINPDDPQELREANEIIEDYAETKLDEGYIPELESFEASETIILQYDGLNQIVAATTQVWIFEKNKESDRYDATEREDAVRTYKFTRIAMTYNEHNQLVSFFEIGTTREDSTSYAFRREMTYSSTGSIESI